VTQPSEESPPPVGPAPVPAAPADNDADFEAYICRAIEQDQGLPAGSLELRDPRDVPRAWLGLWEGSKGRQKRPMSDLDSLQAAYRPTRRPLH
jgi:hypothetical protein